MITHAIVGPYHLTSRGLVAAYFLGHTQGIMSLSAAGLQYKKELGTILHFGHPSLWLAARLAVANHTDKAVIRPGKSLQRAVMCTMPRQSDPLAFSQRAMA
jgi:hypothetical protein